MKDKQLRKKLEKEFDYINSKVLEMRAEAEHMSGDAKERINKEVDGLAARSERLKGDFERSTEGLGEDMWAKFSNGLEEIKQAFKALRDRFK